MARLAISAANLCQRLQELYPQKLQFATKQSEQSSPFRRWTTGSGAGSSYRHHDHRNMYNKQMSEGASPMPTSGSGGSNVARWSLGLEQLLADPAGAAAFAHFLAKEFADENIRFWWSCEQYSSTEEPDKRVALANDIWQRHLAEGALEPVNVDASARRAAALLLYHDPPPPDLFLQAQKQIFNVMKFDSYPRFLRSPVHAECARADLRGQPSPYPPHSNRQQAEVENSPNKLKKSASNASERRRSGGGSLLPWKIRAASRERSNNNTNDNGPPPVTDVLKSGQSIAGQSMLCRVVLPDGATSVVGVESTVTVGRLVDKMLQRRNLLCTTYDVLIKDSQQGTSTVVDLNCGSEVLGGREAVVERRAVVRVEVSGRCVAVRCRPARRLRHVLRPVLARYHAHQQNGGSAHRAVLRDGVLLHPDTLMQELDGARLQIVEVSETGEYKNTVDTKTECSRIIDQQMQHQKDDDADSMSDLALRLQDEQDVQNGVSAGSSRASSNSSTLCQVPGQNVGQNTGQDTSQVSGQGGRVRAALRPGPPLHHHPLDFLENLRETQRQRLQIKIDSTQAQISTTQPPTPEGSGPSGLPEPLGPKTPPPLPPKPAQRTTAPTLV